MAWDNTNEDIKYTVDRRKRELQELRALREFWNSLFDSRLLEMKSLRMFVTRLGFERVTTALQIVESETWTRPAIKRGAGPWLFFCKVCHNWIKDEEARKVVTASKRRALAKRIFS